MEGCIIHEVLISFWGFTRFWSLPSPAEGAFTRAMSHRQPIYEVLISFIVLFSAWSFRFLFIGKLCKALLLFTAFCEFPPPLWGAAPFFPPLFRQKSTFFVETAQSDSQHLVAFYECKSHVVVSPPLQIIYEVLISIRQFLSRRKIQTSYMSSSGGRPTWEIKTS